MERVQADIRFTPMTDAGRHIQVSITPMTDAGRHIQVSIWLSVYEYTP